MTDPPYLDDNDIRWKTAKSIWYVFSFNFEFGFWTEEEALNWQRKNGGTLFEAKRIKKHPGMVGVI